MRIDVTLPKQWEDLTTDQVLFIIKLLNESLPRTEFLSAAYLYFSGWKVVKTGSTPIVFKQGKLKFSVEIEVFQALCNQLEWITSSIGNCINPMSIGRAQGCDRDLYDVTLDQFLFADSYYQAYTNNRKPDYLAILAATFYFKRRQSFDDEKIVKHRYKYFLKHPLLLQQVLMWYTGTKLMLKNKFPELFKDTEGGEDKAFDPEKIYLNTLSALNCGRIIDNPKVLQSPCIEALHELNRLSQVASKLKEK